MTDEIKKPRLMALELTRHCRFHCPHCRADAGFADPDSELTTAQWKKVLKSISAFTKCVIIFTGGEPMERRDIYELISFTRKLGLQPVLATCGYLIDEASVKRLKEAGLVALSLSLDGAHAQTHDAIRRSDGSFDSVMKAAKLAASADLPFQVNTTISKINVDEVNAIALLAEQIGACCFNPFILVPTGRGREMPKYMLDPVEYETLLNRLLDLKLSSPIDIRVTCGPQFARVFHQSSAEKRVGAVNGCIGGSEFAFVSSTGDLQVCGFLQIPVGNILQKGFSFKKTWRDSELLKQIRDRASYTGKCVSCDWRDICGGCRARAYAASGDYLASDPACEYKAGVKKKSKAQLTSFQKRLCNELQNCLPITKRPFQKIADKLQIREKVVLLQIRELKKRRIVRKFGAVVNYKALGEQSTLATAHIEKRKMDAVVKAIDALDGVSHNYLREHYYNLWFTLRADSQKQINTILNKLSKKFKTDFHSLPAVTQFKLDVRFDAESDGFKLLRSRAHKLPQKRVRMSDIETRVLLGLQQNFKITLQPFDYLCTGHLSIEKVLSTIKGLLKKGVLRRIAAVIDYRKVGFRVNVLFACKVTKRRIKKIGEALAKMAIVSHCYSRKGFKDFNYNLFAMCHAESMDRIDRVVSDFARKERIEKFALLPTVMKQMTEGG